MLATLSGARIEHAHGCMLTVSHAFYRKIKKHRKANQYDLDQIENWDELKTTVNLLIDRLDNQQSLIASAAIEGISLIGSITPLPITEKPGELFESNEPMEVDNLPKTVTKAGLGRIVLRLLKSAHSRAKIREEAAICLGKLAIGDGKFFAQQNLNAYIKMVKLTKETTLNIAIAKSIVYTILGRDDNIENVEEITQINPHCNDEQLNEFLLKVIHWVVDPSPSSRNATALWLLALVKNCSDREPIRKNTQLLQKAFTELLSDESGKNLNIFVKLSAES